MRDRHLGEDNEEAVQSGEDSTKPYKIMKSTTTCNHIEFARCNSVREIRNEFGIGERAATLLGEELELAAEQYGISPFRPGLVRCPDCEDEVVVLGADDGDLLLPIEPGEFSKFVLGLVESARANALGGLEGGDEDA